MDASCGLRSIPDGPKVMDMGLVDGAVAVVGAVDVDLEAAAVADAHAAAAGGDQGAGTGGLEAEAATDEAVAAPGAEVVHGEGRGVGVAKKIRRCKTTIYHYYIRSDYNLLLFIYILY